MKTMNKKIYVKPQMEMLEDAVTMILAVSANGTTTDSEWNAARGQDSGNFDFDEEKE